MQEQDHICQKCGHKCHCFQPDCKECVNDVCTDCDCKTEIPSSFFKRN